MKDAAAAASFILPYVGGAEEGKSIDKRGGFGI